MTVTNWLSESIQILTAAGVQTARLDAEILLSDVLGEDRSWLHAHGKDNIKPLLAAQGSSLRALDVLVSRRAEHEPIAYIRGVQEFYGRNFFVSPDTLTPRPETETMIELLLEEMGGRTWEMGSELQVFDVGTGSGCILVTAALELSRLNILDSPPEYIGLDISKSALEIACKNAQKHGVSVRFKEFDLLRDTLPQLPTPNSQLLVLANLPYVPTDFKINLAASKEPPFAIYGGTDGLGYYRELFSQIASMKNESRTALVFTELLPPQHTKLENIAKNAGFTLQNTQDLIQVFTSTPRK